MIKLKLDDQGKRLEHYTDVLDLWNEAASHLRAKNTLGSNMKLEELEVAITILHNTMEGIDREFNEDFYRKEINIIARNRTHAHQ
jgi:hypothetical protein